MAKANKPGKKKAAKKKAATKKAAPKKKAAKKKATTKKSVVDFSKGLPPGAKVTVGKIILHEQQAWERGEYIGATPDGVSVQCAADESEK